MIKKAWIVLNGILGVLCLYLFLSSPAPSRTEALNAEPTLSPGKGKNPKSAKNTPVTYGAPAALPDADAACDRIISADVFSQVRSPLANTRTGRGELVLLGTFKIGNIEGAIIQQKSRNYQFNPFLMQAMRASGAPPPPGGMGPGGRRGGMPMPPDGSNYIGLAKQYVRVGETLSNGYMLCEITRSRAVLMRGNDKMELELQDPSKNRAATTSSAPRLNAGQQLQQAQMIMQGQMMRTMQMMQQNMQGGGAPGRGNRGGGNRGGRR